MTSQVSGIVQSIRVRENQEVRGGQLLIQIDTTDYALNLADSRAALQRAEVDLEVRLLQDELIEDPELRAARAARARVLTGVSAAEVNVLRAEIEMEKTRVTAPFAGRIADLEVVEGQYVGGGTELFTVVTLDPIKVSVSVLETAVVNLEEGRGASMVFSAMPDTTFTSRIEYINPVVDLQTNTTRVTVLLPNADGRIRPGMYADARLEARQVPDVVLVPRSAIRETEDRRSHLFVEQDGRAKWIYVPLGRMNETLVELLGEPGSQEWVEPGWTVLIDGHQSIIHDAARPAGRGMCGRRRKAYAMSSATNGRSRVTRVFTEKPRSCVSRRGRAPRARGHGAAGGDARRRGRERDCTVRPADAAGPRGEGPDAPGGP